MEALRLGSLIKWWFRGVSKKPGAITLTVMLYGAPSAARQRLSMTTAALLAEYATTSY